MTIGRIIQRISRLKMMATAARGRFAVLVGTELSGGTNKRKKRGPKAGF
jgi:hypothetical protein